MKTNIFNISLYLLTALLWLSPLSKIEAGNKHLTQDTVVQSFTGRIIGEKKEALSYAQISVAESNISTVSNAEGYFTIKVPANLLHKNLQVSFIGHESKQVAISSLQTQGNRIELIPLPFLLPILEVVSKDPTYIIQQMMYNRDLNYCKKDKKMTAFYRETIKKRNSNISLSEAIVDVYKRGINSSFNDVATLYKSRKSTDYSKLDTLAFKLMGGPYNNIYMDVMRYPDIIFTENITYNYEFELLNTESIGEHTVYVLGFKQQPYITTPLYYGKLYIEVENFALVRAEFDLNLERNEEATRFFVKKKPMNARISTTQASYIVDYRQIDNLWYYAYSRIDLGLKINWRRKLFNTYYNSSIEMAATNWGDEVSRQEFRGKARINPSVIIQDEASGFANDEFWGEHNIIEPDKSIENAINKIRRQLNKELYQNE